MVTFVACGGGEEGKEGKERGKKEKEGGRGTGEVRKEEKIWQENGRGKTAKDEENK